MSALRTLGLLSPLLLALPPAPVPVLAQPPSFEDKAEVFAVEVPVYVVGRDGAPVRGLTAANFEVFDEGKAQTISGFEVIDLDVLGAGGANRGANRQGGQERPAHAVPAETAPLAPAARRHFLLLFDLSFSTPSSVLKARLAARDFLLRALAPSDLAAVATISLETGPRLVVTFTPDRAQLARAIDTLGMQRRLAGEIDPLRFLVDLPDMVRPDASSAGQGELPDIRFNAEAALLEYLTAISLQADKMERSFERSRISAMFRALSDLARSLDSVKGRKHVVYFSEGFDSRLLLGRTTVEDTTSGESAREFLLSNRFVDTDTRYGNTELQGDVNRMLEEFRRADCVIQAVDIGGLRTTEAVASEAPRRDVTGRAGEEALFYMANETGGELFKDTNDMGRQLGRLFDRTAVTYLLTFQRSDLKADGSYHRLRVKAKLPAGARLHHRRGYYAPRPFADLHPLEKSLLASDGIASAAARRDLDLKVLAAPFRATPDQAYVPVIIEVGGRSLLAGHDGDRLNVEFYTYVSDAQGEMKDFFTQMVGLDIPGQGKGREAMLASGIKYYGHLELAPGRYRVRVLVRNADTGRTGVESVAVTVPAYREARPQLLPPFFFDEPGRWLLVRERNGESEGQGSVVYPFTVNGEPYVPAVRPRLGREQEARLCLVAYNLGAEPPVVEGEVLAADGRAVAGGRLTLVERTATGIAGVDKLLATFRPSGLAAGDYTLKVRVTDPATGRQEINATPFYVVNRGES
jgi:VWFA-related protein